MRTHRSGHLRTGVRTALLCLLIVCAIPVGALQVEARLDTSVVQLGQPIRLMLEMDEKPAQPPDLGILEHDFHIVGRHGSSSRSSINGQVRERYQMVLTLVPRRTGVLEIPPIRFADTATATLHLAVAEATAQPGLGPTPGEAADALSDPIQTRWPFPPPPSQPVADSDIETDTPVLLEASIEPAQVRIAQQAVLIARVLMPKPLLTAPFLHEPQAGGASVLLLGEDWDRITRGSTNYGIYERRYVVFPREVGRLEITPLVLEAWAPGADRQPQPLRVSSESLALQVLPAADTPPGASWLPARDVRLTEIAPEIYQIRLDQSLERMVDLRAEGIAAADLPALASSTPSQLEIRNSLEGLWDEHTPEGIIGTRRERIRITAREPGRYRLPAISLSWWDTDNGKWKTTGLPARDLIVLAADADEPLTPALFEPPAETVDTWTQAPNAEAPQTTQAPSSPASPAAQPNGTAESRPWLWIALALAAAWLLTMAAWWGSRRRAEATNRHQGDNPPALQRPIAPEDPLAQAIDQVRYAYESGEGGAAREALLAWAALALPEHMPGNLALLAKRCSEPLRSEILLLEQAFFSPQPLHWERRRVWERLPGFEPIPLQEPASFRRKKPLRRHTSPPDAIS